MFKALRLHDPILFGFALLATVLGIVCIFDAGYVRALKDGSNFIPREVIAQIAFLPLALFLGGWVARVRPEQWRKWSKLVWIVAFVALLLPMVPGLGVEMNGAKRWVKLFSLPMVGQIMIQPAEFAKVAVVIYLAGVFAGRPAWPKKIKAQKTWAHWLDNVAIPKLMRLMPAFWVLAAVVLIEKEPDLGTGAVVAAIAYAMFFAGGVTKKSIIWAAVLAAAGVMLLIHQEPYRLDRIVNHGSRWSESNMDDVGWQTVQSEVGMASGGLLGNGPGNGRAKHVMPAATTDFMLTTIAEEFGFLGAAFVVLVLGVLAMRLIMIAPTAATPFGSLVLSGVGWWIAIQTCVNVMMANGTLPAIGIPLPFISSGGSSLIALWLAMGLCQSALSPQPVKEEESAPDRYRWGNRRARLSRA